MANSTLYKYNTDTGIIVPDVATLRDDTRSVVREVFGGNISVADQTPQGRIIEAVSLLKADILGINASTSNQLNISYSTGRFLDNIGAFYGVYRNPASNTKISIIVTGDENTVVTAGSLISSKKGIKYSVAADIKIGSDGVAEGVAIATESGIVEPSFDPESDTYDPVTTITSGLIGWDTVEGERILGIGAEEESDDAFRKRILESRVFGVSFVESIASELNKISGVRSSFVYDNGNGYGVVYTEDGSIVKESEAKSQGLKGVLIPAHHVLVIADCDADDYTNVAKAIFKTKSVGSGLVRLYEQNGKGFGDWDVQDSTKVDTGWKYTRAVGITDEWYSGNYIMYFMTPITFEFSIVIDVIKNKYTGTNLVSDVKRCIEQWALGNVSGVDGLSVNQPIFSHECAAAVSTKIPEIQIMDCSLYNCPLSRIREDGQGNIIPPSGIVRQTKIPVNCIQKGVITDNNILVRVFDAHGNRIVETNEG